MTTIRDPRSPQPLNRSIETSGPAESKPVESTEAPAAKPFIPTADALDSSVRAKGPTLSPPPPGAPVPVPQADLYPLSPIASGIVHAHGSVGLVVHHATAALGADFRTAGGLLRTASVSLPAPSRAEAEELGSAYERFTGELDQHFTASFVDADAISTKAQKLADDGVSLSTRVRQAVASSAVAVKDAVRSVGDASVMVVEAVKNFSTEFSKATDYRDHVSKLGPGDSYTLGLDSYADITLARVKGRSSLRVSRDDTGYSVSVDGALGGGVVLSWGTAIGLAGLSMQNAMVGEGGGAVEMRFTTVEQATQAVEVLLRSSKRTVPVTDETPLKDWSDLLPCMNAVEVLGAAGIDLNATLGVIFGGNATVGMRTSKSARLEAGAEGPQLVVRTTVGSSSVGDTGSSLDVFASPVHTSNRAVELSVVRRYVYPKGTTFEQARSEPFSRAKDLTKHGQDEVELSFESDSGVLGQMGGRGGKVAMACDSADGLSMQLLRYVGVGDVVEAVKHLPEGIELAAEVRPHRRFGVRMTPNFSVMGVSAGVDFVAQRLDARPEEGMQWKGTPEEIAKQISKTHVSGQRHPLDFFGRVSDKLLGDSDAI